MNWRVVGLWAAHAASAAIVTLVVGRIGGVVAQAGVVAVVTAIAATSSFRKIPTTFALLGGWAAISPITVAGSVLIWLIPAAKRRSVWAGATLAAASLPLGVWLVMHPGSVVTGLATVAAAIVVWSQREQWKELGF